MIIKNVCRLWASSMSCYFVSCNVDGSPLSIRREWQKAQDHGHHGELSQRTSAVFASWWWWWWWWWMLTVSQHISETSLSRQSLALALTTKLDSKKSN